jgi:hypothetical protein
MTIRVPLCVVSSLAFGVGLAAQLPEKWQHWRYSAPIEIAGGAAAPPPGAASLVRVTIPNAVTMRALPGWDDVRVIDSRGGETPFVLHANEGRRTFDRRAVPRFELSAVDGQYQQAIVDTGDGALSHNSVKLRISTGRDLLSWVEIAVSGDLTEWRVVRDRAPIYVLSDAGRGEATDVSYSESLSRYLRVRVLDGSGSYTIEGVELGREVSTPEEHVASGIALQVETGEPGRSPWVSEGDASPMPVSRVEFEAPRVAFVRGVTIEGADARGDWRPIARGEILRRPGGEGEERAWLTVDVAGARAARWRVTVDHGNDAPVADLVPRLMTTPRHVVFRPEAGQSYRLIFGHPRADAPAYDLARLTDAAALNAAPSATLGPVEENAAWVDPAPFTERYDYVLWGALIVAVLALGAVAVRTMRAR